MKKLLLAKLKIHVVHWPGTDRAPTILLIPMDKVKPTFILILEAVSPKYTFRQFGKNIITSSDIKTRYTTHTVQNAVILF